MFSFLLLVWIRRLTFFPFLVLTCFYLELIAVPLLIGSSFLIYFLWTQKLFPKWIGQLLQIYINKCIYFLLALWCKTVILFLQLFGIKFRIFIEKKEEERGEEDFTKPCTESCLILSNHPTDADWMFLWYFIKECLFIEQLKIVLKKELKKMPLLGLATSIWKFLFLERNNWTKDQETIKETCTYYKTKENSYTPTQLLLFPEGTDSTNSKAQVHSRKYAQDHNLPIYEYVLHPRTTGFEFILNQLPDLKSIYDITIGFRGPSGKDTSKYKFSYLLKGYFPSEICFFIRKFSLTNKEEDTKKQEGKEKIHEIREEPEKWIRERFAEKEQLLKSFYNPQEDQTNSMPLSSFTELITASNNTVQTDTLFINFILVLLFMYMCLYFTFVSWFSFLVVCLVTFVINYFYYHSLEQNIFMIYLL